MLSTPHRWDFLLHMRCKMAAAGDPRGSQLHSQGLRNPRRQIVTRRKALSPKARNCIAERWPTNQVLLVAWHLGSCIAAVQLRLRYHQLHMGTRQVALSPKAHNCRAEKWPSPKAHSCKAERWSSPWVVLVALHHDLCIAAVQLLLTYHQWSKDSSLKLLSRITIV